MVDVVPHSSYPHSPFDRSSGLALSLLVANPSHVTPSSNANACTCVSLSCMFSADCTHGPASTAPHAAVHVAPSGARIHVSAGGRGEGVGEGVTGVREAVEDEVDVRVGVGVCEGTPAVEQGQKRLADKGSGRASHVTGWAGLGGPHQHAPDVAVSIGQKLAVDSLTV